MKGSSRGHHADQLVKVILNCEFSLQMQAWYVRVPSASNIADDPSRGFFDAILRLGYTRVACN